LPNGQPERPARILDVDLDFFLANVFYKDASNERPGGNRYAPWPEQDVRDFLERGCGLDKGARLPGKVVVKHDEVFYDWRERIEGELLLPPFEVVHVDAHADLGMGDASYAYIMTEHLGKPVHLRTHPPTTEWSGINEGNYLAFAIACRWISRLTYVRHEKWEDDLLPCYMKGADEDSGFIQLKYFGQVDAHSLMLGHETPLALEPEVPFQMIAGRHYRNKRPFDRMYLALSPSYTPEGADKLIPIIKEYMAED
jgi:hypothetical protein